MTDEQERLTKATHRIFEIIGEEVGNPQEAFKLLHIMVFGFCKTATCCHEHALAINDLIHEQVITSLNEEKEDALH